MTGPNRYKIDYHGRPVELEIIDDHELVLFLDGVPRKRRNRVGVTCVYVWTNIELHWEEHHFIEARWWPQSGRVCVTANGVVLLEDVRMKEAHETPEEARETPGEAQETPEEARETPTR